MTRRPMTEVIIGILAIVSIILSYIHSFDDTSEIFDSNLTLDERHSTGPFS